VSVVLPGLLPGLLPDVPPDVPPDVQRCAHGAARRANDFLYHVGLSSPCHWQPCHPRANAHGTAPA